MVGHLYQVVGRLYCVRREGSIKAHSVDQDEDADKDVLSRRHRVDISETNCAVNDRAEVEGGDVRVQQGAWWLGAAGKWMGGMGWGTGADILAASCDI